MGYNAADHYIMGYNAVHHNAADNTDMQTRRGLQCCVAQLSVQYAHLLLGVLLSHAQASHLRVGVADAGHRVIVDVAFLACAQQHKQAACER
eukprot:1157913-Pelagomonas_calceolata.AAC.3